MFARLNVKLTDDLPYPLIPREAVMEIDGKMYVYVMQQDRPLKREVKIGHPSGEKVAVLEGLTPGERIVTKGAVLLKGEEMKSEESGRSDQSSSNTSPPPHT